MGASVRPDATTVSPKKPAPKGDSGSVPNVLGLPFTIPRPLSPEEFAQAKHAHSGQLAAANFPVLPPVVVNPEGGAGRDFDGVPLGEQAKAGVKAVGHAATHPVETAKALVQSIADDLTGVFLTPVEGSRNEPNAKTGELPYPHLPLGAVVTKENTPNAISHEEQQRAAFNTAINAAFAMAPELAAPARVALNAAVGAYYDPDQPVRGAVAGTVLGEGMHAAGKAVGGAARAMREGGGPALEARPGSVLPQGGSGSPLRPNAPRNAPGETYTAPLDAGDNPRMLNVQKLGLSPEGEAQLRQMLPATGEKVKVTQEETAALARELEMDPEALHRRIGDWSGAEALAAQNIVAQNTERIAELSKITADGTKTLAEREGAQSEINRLTGDVRTLAGRLMGERSKMGRDLNTLKQLAKRNMDPATWLAQAQRVRGVLGITPEQQARVLQLVNAKDRAGLVSYISDLHQSTSLEKTLAAWKAGLLTGTGTHVTNMAGGGATAAMENVKDIPAVAVDMIASLVTGERTKAPSFRGNLLESAVGLGRGVRKAAKVLREGDDAQLEKWDFRQTNYDTPALHWYVNGVFRLLDAEDQIWRGAALGRAMEEELRVRARQLAKMDVTPGGQGHAFDKILADLRQHPPLDVVVKAAAEADYAMLKAPNAPHKFITAGKRALPPAGQAGVDFVVPFSRTPTNAAIVYGIDYTPLGFFKTLAGQLKEPSQRKLADGMGRAVTGSAFIAMGAMLLREGLMTGSTVTPAEQAQGKKPHSVLIDGRWYDVTRIPGPGTLLAMGAEAASDVSAAEGGANKIGAAAFANVRVIADQPMVSGLSGIVDAVRDRSPAKDRAGAYLTKQAASVIPSAVNQLAGAMDDKVRDPHGFVETMESRVPGLRERVPAKTDMLGRDVANDQSGGRAYLDFLRSNVSRPDPLLEEMARLGVAMEPPDKTFTVKGVTHERSDDERRTLKKLIGAKAEKRLRRVFADPDYAEASDDERKDAFENAIREVRSGAYAAERRRLKGKATASTSTSGGP
jgi:hypothetical protein